MLLLLNQNTLDKAQNTKFALELAQQLIHGFP